MSDYTIDELEMCKTNLDEEIKSNEKKIKKLQNANLEIKAQIKQIENMELNKLGDKDELITDDWRFTRTKSNPTKASWWQVTKTNPNDKPAKLLKILEPISENLVNKTVNVTAIKKYIASGRFKPYRNNMLIDVETGQEIPYIAALRPDKLNVKAVQK